MKFKIRKQNAKCCIIHRNSDYNSEEKQYWKPGLSDIIFLITRLLWAKEFLMKILFLSFICFDIMFATHWGSSYTASYCIFFFLLFFFFFLWPEAMSMKVHHYHLLWNDDSRSTWLFAQYHYYLYLNFIYDIVTAYWKLNVLERNNGHSSYLKLRMYYRETAYSIRSLSNSVATSTCATSIRTGDDARWAG